MNALGTSSQAAVRWRQSRTKRATLGVEGHPARHPPADEIWAGQPAGSPTRPGSLTSLCRVAPADESMPSRGLHLEAEARLIGGRMTARSRPQMSHITGFTRPSNAQGNASPTDSSDRVVAIKLEVIPPVGYWAGTFSRRHPELIVEAVNVVAIDHKGIVGEFEIHGADTDWTKEIAGCPGVFDVENLSAQRYSGRYRVRYRYSPLVPLVSESQSLVRFPATVRNGRMDCELIVWRPQLRRLLEGLSEFGNKARLVSLGPPGPRRRTLTFVRGSKHGPTPQGDRNSRRSATLDLTPTQRLLFHQAFALGYYDVPRRITLTKLALKVSRSKSSISKTLAAVDGKLAAFGIASGA